MTALFPDLPDVPAAFRPHLPYPGCVALFTTAHGFFPRAIQLSQWLRWKKGWRRNHAALVAEVVDRHIFIVQMEWHCEKVRLDDLENVAFFQPPRGTDVVKAVAYAESKIGIKYGVLTIVSIFLTLFSPKAIRVNFRAGGHDSLICSALVARAWEHGGWNCDPADPFQITPAELDEMALEAA